MRVPLLCLVLTLASRCFASVDITTTSLPNGTYNKSYSATVYATGGCTPYKWSVVSGALPAGITAKPSSTTTSLLLSGVPTSAKTYTPTLQVTGCGGSTYKLAYKIVIQPPSGVTISTSSLPNGIVGNAYSAGVNAIGGCTPYKWSIVSGALPAGVTMKVSSTTMSLLLSGTPSSASTYAPTVQVTGCGGGTYKHSYSIAIQGTANHVVDVSWKASTTSDVTGYNLYRSPDGVNWKKANVSLIASTMYNDATVANGSTYYYAATAVDINGHESSKSASVKVTVP
jgi:large repetitive protein